MGNYEIVRSYREAKHKRGQIVILAELNGCSREEIEKILTDAGENIQKGGRPKKEKESESMEEKMVIPDVVKEVLTQELIRLTETVEELTKRAEEIRVFLYGGKEKERC